MPSAALGAHSSQPDDVISQRLSAQRLTAGPFEDPVDAVRLLLCAQAQDPPLARYSLGLRTANPSDTSVRAALDDGRLVRTHILRPTWHFVAAEDLRWILDLTSAKVESSLAGRNRQLGVDPPMIERAHGELSAMLEGRAFQTADQVKDRFASVGLPGRGEVVRHLLLLAELRGLVCSGPLQDSVHTYGLVDELVPPAAPLDREDATRRFVHRFFSGHGPASEQDLRRWTTLTLKEIRGALADLGDELATVTCSETQLWFDPATSQSGPARRRVALLPTFDESFLLYRSVGFARSLGHPRGDEPHSFAEAGGGVVIVDQQDAGWWKRTVGGAGKMTVRLALATSLTAEQVQLVMTEATGLAAFFDKEATVEMAD